MFKSLKEKLTSWFKKPEEPKKEVKKKKKKLEKAPKKEKKEKPKKTKIKRPKKVEQKEQPAQIAPAQIHAQDEPPVQTPQEPPAPVEQIPSQPTEQPVQEEKPGFFRRLFSKKEKPEIKKAPDEPTAQTPQLAPQESALPIAPPAATQEPSAQITPAQTPQEQPPQVEQPIQEEPKENFFTKLASRLSTSTLNQEQFDELFPELEMILLENNVALEALDQIRLRLSKDLVGIEVKKSKVQETILNSLKETIESLLIEPPNLIQQINKKLSGPFVIIFVGINGSGKTTTIAKFAHLLKKHNITSVLAAADTFRAASIEQIKFHGKKLDVPVIASQYGSDPASVAFDAIKHAKAKAIKAVLIDTAGRMYTKTDLMKEMEKISRISKPDLKIFVGESITGNDATEQAKAFNEAINIDGIILTKADVDEKAGTILSVSQVTSKPIYFLGTGQDYEDLAPFTKKDVLKNLGLE